jgi:uncharacterized protein YjbI with pentapeptide repeats
MPKWTNGTVNLRKTDISDSTFQEMEAKKLTLTEVNLAGSQINCANLEGAVLNDVNLTGAKITIANMSDIIFEKAQMTGAQFRDIDWPIEGVDANYNAEELYRPVVFDHCILRNTQFTKCDLSNATITDCDITGLTINGIKIDELLSKINNGMSDRSFQCCYTI